MGSTDYERVQIKGESDFEVIKEEQNNEKYGAVELNTGDVDLSRSKCETEEINSDCDIDIRIKTEIVKENTGECQDVVSETNSFDKFERNCGTSIRGDGMTIMKQVNDCNLFDDVLGTRSIKYEPLPIATFGEGGIYDCSRSERDLTVHNNANELNIVDVDFTDVSTFKCKTEQTKSEDDIDIHYEDVKTEIEEKNPVAGEICNKKSVVIFTRDSECDSSFTSKQGGNVQQSLKTFHCKSCSKDFSTLGNLKVHERVHTGEKPYTCNTCSKKFAHSSTLKVHERIHKGEKYYNCKICSKNFHTSSLLKVHERTHTSENAFQCKLCQKTFSYAKSLKTHERTHTGEKPYTCKMCSKKFTQSSTLKDHERIHTGEKPYKCKICSKDFQTSRLLKIHERTHTGENAFQCKFCRKTFNYASCLKTHERIHTGEKPYTCKMCSKKFTQWSTLKDHERIHTGEKPYKCKICSRNFHTSRLLKFHERTHTRE